MTTTTASTFTDVQPDPVSGVTNVYTKNDQSFFIEHALQDIDFYERNAKAFKTANLWHDENQKIAKTIADYHDQYNALPTRDQIVAMTTVDGSLIGKPGYEITDANTQWAQNRLKDYWNDANATDAVVKLSALSRDGKFSAMLPTMTQATENLLHPATDKPVNLDDDLDAMIEHMNAITKNKVSSGWTEVDRIMEGGFAPGEMNIVCAPPGEGKSLILCNLATNLAKQGKKVLFITLELEAFRVMARLGQQFTGCRSNSEMELATMQLMLKKVECRSNIDVKYINRGSTSADIDAIIKDTKKEYDAVCVDYMDLVAPDGAVAKELKFQADDEMSYELRQIAVKRNLCLFTASQFSRTRERKPGETYELRDIAGGYSKAFNADNVIVGEKKTNKKEIEEDAKARGGDSPIKFQVLGYKLYFPKIRNGANNGQWCHMNWDEKSLRLTDKDISEFNDLPQPKKETEPMLTEDNDHDDDPTPPNDDGPGGLPGPSSEKSADASADADAGDTVVDDVGTAETPQSEGGSGDLSQTEPDADGDGQSQDGEITEKETAGAVSTPEKETENENSDDEGSPGCHETPTTSLGSGGEIQADDPGRTQQEDGLSGDLRADKAQDADDDAGIEGELKLMAVEQMQSAGLTEPEMQQVIKSNPEWFDADLEPIINDIISNRKETENEPSEADLGTDAGDGAPSDGAATETEASAPTDNAEGPDSEAVGQDEGRVDGDRSQPEPDADRSTEEGAVEVNEEITRMILAARHGPQWDVEKAAEIIGCDKGDILKVLSREILHDVYDCYDENKDAAYHKDLGGLFHDYYLYRTLTSKFANKEDTMTDAEVKDHFRGRLKSMGLTDDEVALISSEDGWLKHTIFDDAREILATRNENGTENEATDGSESGATEGSAPGASKDATGGKSPQPDTAEAGGSKILGVPATTPAVENSAPENDQDGQKSHQATSASQTYERQHAVPSAPKDKEPKSIRVENDPELDELNRIEREKAANSTSTLAAGIIDRLKKEGKIA